MLCGPMHIRPQLTEQIAETKTFGRLFILAPLSFLKCSFCPIYFFIIHFISKKIYYCVILVSWLVSFCYKHFDFSKESIDY